MTSELTALARQGDPSAIAALMNRTLKPKGITAKAVARHGCLQIQLESDQVPNQVALTRFISKGLNNLGVRSIRSVRLYGYQAGAEVPAWEEELVLPTADPDESTIVEVDDRAEMNGTMPAPSITSSSFESEWQDDAPPSPPPRSKPRLLLPGLAIALLLGLGALAYALWPRQSPQPEESLSTVEVVPPATPTISLPPSQTPFRDAVNRATEAASVTQTATSAEEWEQVVRLWEEAIVLLQQVPEADPNYALAQEKVTEYQGNLSYAQQKLDAAL